MKAILATIIAASLTVGCGMIEGEQTTTDSGSSGSSTPTTSTSDTGGSTTDTGGSTSSGGETTSVVRTPIDDVASISSGGYDTCFLMNDTSVKCFGHTFSDGTISTPTSSYQSKPVNIDVSGVAQISTGWGHACALLDNGSVNCWGENYYGQLGNGSTTAWGTRSNTPMAVQGLSNVTSINSGYYHTCALLSDKTVKCWGIWWDSSSKLNSSTPIDMGYTNVEKLAGHGGSARGLCYITSGNTMTCEGGGSISSFYPHDGSTTNVQKVAVGWRHILFQDTSGSIKCWGRNEHGQCGIGVGSFYSNSYVNVPGSATLIYDNVTQLTAGENHSCALIDSGSVKCWGQNHHGQLGDGNGSYGTTSTSPTDVLGLSDVKEVSAGRSHTCALLNSGQVKCWSQYLAGSFSPVNIYE